MDAFSDGRVEIRQMENFAVFFEAHSGQLAPDYVYDQLEVQVGQSVT